MSKDGAKPERHYRGIGYQHSEDGRRLPSGTRALVKSMLRHWYDEPVSAWEFVDRNFDAYDLEMTRFNCRPHNKNKLDETAFREYLTSLYAGRLEEFGSTQRDVPYIRFGELMAISRVFGVPLGLFLLFSSLCSEEFRVRYLDNTEADDVRSHLSSHVEAVVSALGFCLGELDDSGTDAFIRDIEFKGDAPSGYTANIDLFRKARDIFHRAYGE